MEKNPFVVSRSSGLRIQWLKALTLSQKSFLIRQPVRTNFQINNRTHNAFFLKKTQFWVKKWIFIKKWLFWRKLKLSKLIKIRRNKRLNDISWSILMFGVVITQLQSSLSEQLIYYQLADMSSLAKEWDGEHSLVQWFDRGED